MVHKLHVKNVLIVDDLDFYGEVKSLELNNRANWGKFFDEHYVMIDRKVGVTEEDIVKMDTLYLKD
jgi:hypothetical protein